MHIDLSFSKSLVTTENGHLNETGTGMNNTLATSTPTVFTTMRRQCCEATRVHDFDPIQHA